MLSSLKPYWEIPISVKTLWEDVEQYLFNDFANKRNNDTNW